MDNTCKCSQCKRVYFVIDKEVCPFCGYDENKDNIFKDLFEDDNPFSNMGVT